MPLSTYIGLPLEINDALKTMLMNLFEDKTGDWQAWIILSQSNNQWEVTITRPDGSKWRHDFGPGEHNPNFIRSKIQEALLQEIEGKGGKEADIL
ncbi:hypothetical protein MYX65_03170 [Acidobacteria bacterium AH-259-L09]|nr:hypothetical protein [Acidobacteria bacterium AH-259-L09]